jgi:hypothetical protein
VHLIQPNNNLFAEVMIGAQASILRKRPDGTPITDSTELIRCAGYGEEGRASDPKIGAQVNARARAGDAITLRNPVALYITRFSNDGINHNGVPVPSFWTLVRGTAAPVGQPFGMGLHLVYEVPPDAGFVVGDLKIGNDPISFGGQLAENVHVGLFAVLTRKGTLHNPAFACDAVPTHPLAGGVTHGEALRRRSDTCGRPLRQGAWRHPEELLDVQDIQGNSLAGFRKDCQRFLFYRMDRTADGIAATRTWLRGLVPDVSSVAEGKCVQSALPADEAPHRPRPTGSVGHLVEYRVLRRRPPAA